MEVENNMETEFDAYIKQLSDNVSLYVQKVEEKVQLSQKYVVPNAKNIYQKSFDKLMAEFNKESGFYTFGWYPLFGKAVTESLQTYPHIYYYEGDSEEYASRCLETMCTSYFWRIVLLDYIKLLAIEDKLAVSFKDYKSLWEQVNSSPYQDLGNYGTIPSYVAYKLKSYVLTSEPSDFTYDYLRLSDNDSKHLTLENLSQYFNTFAMGRKGRDWSYFPPNVFIPVDASALVIISFEREYKTELFTRLAMEYIEKSLEVGNSANVKKDDSLGFDITTVKIWDSTGKVVLEINDQGLLSKNGEELNDRNWQFIKWDLDEVYALLNAKRYKEARGSLWIKEEEKEEAKVYKHYKGGLYLYITDATDTETGEKYVVYKDVEGKVWSRPYDMFHSIITWSSEPRFELLPEIEKTDYILNLFK